MSAPPGQPDPAADKALTDRQLREDRGCSELLSRNGLSVNLVPGDENAYKITTQADLDRFIQEMK